jgi:hypothetical protein
MGKLSKVNNGGRERGKMSSQRKIKRRGIYTPSHKNVSYSVPGQIIRPKTGKIRPPIWVTHKKSLAKTAITRASIVIF